MRRLARTGRLLRAGGIGLATMLALPLAAPFGRASPPDDAPDRAVPGAPVRAAPTQSASYAIRAWTVENGLPQGSVYDLTETTDGYLWIATYGGLVRFDGFHFSLFDATALPSLASAQVQAVATARDGSLWVAASGANVFRTDGRRELEVLPGRHDRDRVRRLTTAPDGTLWIASDTVVESHVEGRWRKCAFPEHRVHSVRTLFIDHAGVVWVGTKGGLFTVRDDRCEPAQVAGLGQGHEVAAIFEDGDRRLWVGGPHGLVGIQHDEAGRRAVRVPGLESRVTAITQSPDGVLWVAASDGVYLLGPVPRVSTPTPRRLASSDDLGSLVHRLLPTRSGAVVAGTADAGIRVFTRRVFDVLGLAAGLPGTRVHHLTGDGAGGVWLGSGCDGLTHVATTLVVRAHGPPELGLVSPCVRGLLRDRDGALWVGQARGGLTRIRPDGSTRTWDPSDGLPRSELGPLLGDREGRVWVGGTSGTLCRVERDERVTCPAAPLDGPRQVVWSLAEDENGSIWIGQVGRVTRLSAHGTRTWAGADGVPPVPIRVLLPQPGGTMWLGTYGGGLARVRNDRTTSLTTSQGLFDNAISAIVTGDHDEVWLLGNRGVFVTRWADLESVADGVLKTLEGSTYGPADGVPEGNGGHPAGANLGQGRIGFATVQGLAVFEPHHLPAPFPVRVLVEDIIGGDRERQDTDTVDVPPGGGPVEIRFAAPAVGWPGAVSVRYQMEGRDRGWVDAGDQRRAIYSGLAPGTYEFRLAGRRSGGPWSTPITTVTLNVRPFWWQTPVARGAAVLAGLLLIAGFVQWRLGAAEKRNRVLAREILERQRAEEDAHRHLLALAHVGRAATAGELTASLAHELGQPLTAIVASAEATRMMLAAPTPDQARIGEILTSISQQGRRASDVIRGLRTFLARGGAELADVDVSELVREVMRLADSSLASARVRLVLDLADHLPPVRGDRVPLQQVVMNLTLNAIDALRARPGEDRCVMIRTRRSGQHVRVSVLDTGPGLGRQDVAELFEPFHTTKAGGMGMGLAICRSIVEAHGGRIRGRNRPRGGSVFSFTIPVARGSEEPTP